MSENSKPAPPERVGKAVTDPLGTKIANALAPTIFFDLPTCWGLGGGGIIQVTLEMIRHTLPPEGYSVDSVAVAHLRMSKDAARQLRDALTTLVDRH